MCVDSFRTMPHVFWERICARRGGGSLTRHSNRFGGEIVGDVRFRPSASLQSYSGTFNCASALPRALQAGFSDFMGPERAQQARDRSSVIRVQGYDRLCVEWTGRSSWTAASLLCRLVTQLAR